MYKDPVFAHTLLEEITQITITYLKAQIKAGANMVQVFDSWAGILSPSMYSEFGTKYVSKICEAIQEVPVTVFAKGAYYAREEIGNLDCQTVGIDWTMDVGESRKLIGMDKTIQGNLDPCVLYADFNTVKEKTNLMLNSFQNQRHIANLGHGVYPDTDPEKVKCFIDTVKEFTRN